MKHILIFLNLLFTTAIFSQSSTIIEYNDGVTNSILSYNGFYNDKYTYQNVDDLLEVFWLNSQWNVNFNGNLIFYSLDSTVTNPPALMGDNWIDNNVNDNRVLNTFVGSGTTSEILPVEWLYFDGEFNEKVILRWGTTNEVNNHYFVVEHSDYGESFSTIGIVYNDTNIINHYYFIPSTFVIGNNFYRIKQIDFDGRLSYSDVINVNVNGQNKISLYSQFIQHNIITVYSNEDMTDISYGLYRLNGSIIFEEKQDFSKGKNLISLTNFRFIERSYVFNINEVNHIIFNY